MALLEKILQEFPIFLLLRSLEDLPGVPPEIIVCICIDGMHVMNTVSLLLTEVPYEKFPFQPQDLHR